MEQEARCPLEPVSTLCRRDKSCTPTGIRTTFPRTYCPQPQLWNDYANCFDLWRVVVVVKKSRSLLSLSSALHINGFQHRTGNVCEIAWYGAFFVLIRNSHLNPLTPNDHYSGRTALLTSKRCILYIYSTNIGTEYFELGIYSPFFPLQNAVCFIIVKCLVPVLFTFYIEGVLK